MMLGVLGYGYVIDPATMDERCLCPRRVKWKQKVRSLARTLLQRKDDDRGTEEGCKLFQTFLNQTAWFIQPHVSFK